MEKYVTHGGGDEAPRDEWAHIGGPSRDESFCYTFVILLPTRYNPPPGLIRGPLIPAWKIRAIKHELTEMVEGMGYGAVERVISQSVPLVATLSDGSWQEPDARESSGLRQYFDRNSLRITANVGVKEGPTVWAQLIARAERWVVELEQEALYLEVHGLGQDRHCYVRRADVGAGPGGGGDD